MISESELIPRLEACIKSATPRAAEAAILLAVTRKFLLDDEEAFSAIFSRLQSLYPYARLNECDSIGFGVLRSSSLICQEFRLDLLYNWIYLATHW